MRQYLIRRAGFAAIVAFGVSTIVFFLLHLIPGDPVEMMLGEMAQPGDLLALRRNLGLDRPLVEQYLDFIQRLVRGDLGTSLHYDQPVIQVILARLPATVLLAFSGVGVALLIALPLGLLSAIYRGTALDVAAGFVSLIGVSMPNFWLGPLLILFFSIHLGWFPVSGSASLKHLFLPAITLGTALGAILTRMIRTSMIEVLGEDFVRTARSKGLAPRTVLFKHALRNALFPVITLLGLQFGTLLTGAIITETIFAWPGIGRMVVQAISTRDYPLVQGAVFVIALT